MSIINETKITYNSHRRQWETWPDDLGYYESLQTGKMSLYPSGTAGKHAAMLAALTNDAPHIAAQVEAMIQNATRKGWPIVGRLLKGGFIVHHEGVELLHLHHYRVQSQSDSTTRYIVSEFENQGWYCQCADWQNGIWVHYGQLRQTYAPYIPNIGPMCKHVAACLVTEAVNPVEPCSVCHGKCYTSLHDRPGPGWPTGITPCKVCNATGFQYVNPHQDMAYYNAKVQDFEAVGEYSQVQELRREALTE